VIVNEDIPFLMFTSSTLGGTLIIQRFQDLPERRNYEIYATAAGSGSYPAADSDQPATNV